MSSRILKPWPERSRTQHEEAAHRVGDFGLADEPAETRCQIADPHALAIPIADPATVDITAADHDVIGLVAQAPQHLRQERFVMLKIGIHHRDIGRG